MHTLDKKKQKGFSLIELLIVVAIILIIAAIAIPNLLRSRMMANQAAAVSTIRNLNNSQAAYLAEFGSVGYASSMAKLGQSVNCDQNGACLVDEVLGCTTEPCYKGAYGYFLTSSASTAPFTDYTSTATPRALGSGGMFNYCSLEDGIIRQEIKSTSSGAAIPRATCIIATQFTPIQ